MRQARKCRVNKIACATKYKKGAIQGQLTGSEKIEKVARCD